MNDIFFDFSQNYESYYVSPRHKKKYNAKNKNLEKKFFLKQKHNKKKESLEQHQKKNTSKKMFVENKKLALYNRRVEDSKIEENKHKKMKYALIKKKYKAVDKLKNTDYLKKYINVPFKFKVCNTNIQIPKFILIKIINFLDDKSRKKLSETCWAFFVLTKSNIIENKTYAIQNKNLYETNFYNIKIDNIRNKIIQNDVDRITMLDRIKKQMKYFSWSKQDKKPICVDHGMTCDLNCDESMEYSFYLYHGYEMRYDNYFGDNNNFGDDNSYDEFASFEDSDEYYYPFL